MVLFQGPSGFDKIHDGVGETKERGDFNAAVEPHYVHVDIPGPEVPVGRPGIFCRDLQVLAEIQRCIRRGGNHKPAFPDLQIERFIDVAVDLPEDVGSHHPNIHGT